MIGVVSKGADHAVCGEPGIPGFYTRVSSFLDWISENTVPLDDNQLSANVADDSADTHVSEGDDEAAEDDE